MNRLALSLLAWAALSTGARAALTSNLLAYYNFDATGSAGLENQADPGTFDATFSGSTGSGADVSGSGFTGNASFNGGDGLSNRPVLSSTLGGVLNLVDGRQNFMSTGISSTDVGNQFTIALWFALTPGATNTSNRYHLLESGDNFNVSLGTNTVGGTITAPSASYNYLGYVNGTTAASVTANGVATGTWHHAAMVYSSGSLTLYIDGSLVGTHTNGSTTNVFNNLLFGRERNSPDPSGDRDWDGMIDELVIWDRALAENEINNGITGPAADSVYQRGLAGLAIPEPSVALLGSLGLLTLLRRRSL
jgi:hypothetical protein